MQIRPPDQPSRSVAIGVSCYRSRMPATDAHFARLGTKTPIGSGSKLTQNLRPELFRLRCAFRRPLPAGLPPQTRKGSTMLGHMVYFTLKDRSPESIEKMLT